MPWILLLVAGAAAWFFTSTSSSAGQGTPVTPTPDPFPKPTPTPPPGDPRTPRPATPVTPPSSTSPQTIPVSKIEPGGLYILHGLSATDPLSDTDRAWVLAQLVAMGWVELRSLQFASKATNAIPLSRLATRFDVVGRYLGTAQSLPYVLVTNALILGTAEKVVTTPSATV